MKYSWKVSAELATHRAHWGSRCGSGLGLSWGLCPRSGVQGLVLQSQSWLGASVLQHSPLHSWPKPFSSSLGLLGIAVHNRLGRLVVFVFFFSFSPFFSQAQAQMATEAANCEPNTEAFVKATLKLPWWGQLEIFLNFFIGTSAL